MKKSVQHILSIWLILVSASSLFAYPQISVNQLDALNAPEIHQVAHDFTTPYFSTPSPSAQKERIARFEEGQYFEEEENESDSSEEIVKLDVLSHTVAHQYTPFIKQLSLPTTYIYVNLSEYLVSNKRYIFHQVYRI